MLVGLKGCAGTAGVHGPTETLSSLEGPYQAMTHRALVGGWELRFLERPRACGKIAAQDAAVCSGQPEGQSFVLAQDRGRGSGPRSPERFPAPPRRPGGQGAHRRSPSLRARAPSLAPPLPRSSAPAPRGPRSASGSASLRRAGARARARCRAGARARSRARCRAGARLPPAAGRRSGNHASPLTADLQEQINQSARLDEICCYCAHF